MENQDIQKQLDEQQLALAKIYKSVEKTRKIIMWSGIISLFMFVIPAVVLIFALPKIMGVLDGGLNVLDGVQNIEEINGDSLFDSLQNLKSLGF